jgi:hypothetical protein
MLADILIPISPHSERAAQRGGCCYRQNERCMIVSPPPKNLPPDTVLNSVQVKRGDVVAVVMLPTRASLKNRL